MNKIKSWLEGIYLSLKTGQNIRIGNDGKAVDEVVIRLNGYYMSVLFDPESGKPTGDFAWTQDPMMFHVPLREHYIAKQEKQS